MRPFEQRGGFQDHNRGPLLHITGMPSSGSWSSIGQGNGWINAGLNNSSGAHDHPVSNQNSANDAVKLFKLSKSIMPSTDGVISSPTLGAELVGTSDGDVIAFSGKGQSAKGKEGKDLFTLDLDTVALSDRRVDKIKDLSFDEGDGLILASATMKLKGIRIGVSRSKKEYKALLSSDADLIFKINKKQTKGVLSANTSDFYDGIDARDVLLRVKGDLEYDGMIPFEMARLN
jgi:hypothetical protein